MRTILIVMPRSHESPEVGDVLLVAGDEDVGEKTKHFILEESPTI